MSLVLWHIRNESVQALLIYQCVQPNLCRCSSPQCRFAGIQVQRRAAASGGPDLGHPSWGASCTERPDTGHDDADGPGEERGMRNRRKSCRCQFPPKVLGPRGPQGPVCRRRRKQAWSMSDDLLWLLRIFYFFCFSSWPLVNIQWFFSCSVNPNSNISLSEQISDQPNEFSSSSFQSCLDLKICPSLSFPDLKFILHCGSVPMLLSIILCCLLITNPILNSDHWLLICAE